MNNTSRPRFDGKRVVSLLFLVALTLGCAIDASAQRVGGWRPTTDNDRAEVEEAAEWAVGEQGRKHEMTVTLVEIAKAEVQTVAGRNFWICMKITMGAEGEDEESEQLVQAVVYRNLKKEFLLKSWTEAEGCERN